MLQTILQLMLSLTILVFVHELGHFLMARLFKCRVERFYLFFNPWYSLFKYKSKRSGTVYGLGWLPLGGYCAISGMIDEGYIENGKPTEAEPSDFRAKKAWQRFLIMIAGILMNLILAIVIYIILAFSLGGKELSGKDVNLGYQFNQVAKDAGFQDGDIIYSIDGNSDINVLSSDFVAKVATAKYVDVYRNGKEERVNISPDFVYSISEDKKGFMSIRMPMVIESIPYNSNVLGKLENGDIIVGVNGKDIEDYLSIANEFSENSGKTISLDVVRDAQRINIQDVKVDDSGKIGVIVSPLDKVYPIKRINYGIFKSIYVGIENTFATCVSYVKSLKLLFNKEGVKQLGGLGSMGMLFSGGFDWVYFLSRTAFLSIIFAVMNLLPIPALDGGHIIFIIIEMIRRKPINPKILMKLQQAGMILLLILMLYANINDVYKFVIK